MARRAHPTVRTVLAVSICLLLGAVAEGKEGFGRFHRDVIRLDRVHPPAVFLGQHRIDVRGNGATAALNQLAQRLERQLEAELVERDRRLMIDPRDAAITVDVDVLQNAGEERWEGRTMQVQRKVGKDSEGKDRYEWVETTVRVKVVVHRFEAAYTVVDRAQQRSLDADTIQVPFQREFVEGRGAPEMFALESEALGTTADRIALRLTPSRESIGVLLPKGSLEDLSKLARAGLWTRFLEGLERLPARPDPVDESYRQYALGTAYESLGYQADDPETTLRYLQQADVHYSQAIEANPGEKFFIKAYDGIMTSKSAEPPLERVRSAITNYRRLEDFRNHLAANPDPNPVPGGGGNGRSGLPSAKELFYDPSSRLAERITVDEQPQRPPSSLVSPFAGPPPRPGAKRRKIVESAQPAAGPIGLSVWIELLDDAGGPGLQVTDRRVFHSGETIRLHFRSNVDGYLVLILLGSSGTSRVLFPDAALGLLDNRLVTGVDLTVPDDVDAWLRFDDNPGEERLLAVFARSARDLERFPVLPEMDQDQTEALLAAAAAARGGKDLVVETDTQSAGEIGTYGVHLGGQPVILELVLQHR